MELNHHLRIKYSLLSHLSYHATLAGAERIELPSRILEILVLPLHQAPIRSERAEPEQNNISFEGGYEEKTFDPTLLATHTDTQQPPKNDSGKRLPTVLPPFYHFLSLLSSVLCHFIKLYQKTLFFIFSQNFSNHPSFAFLPTHSSSPRNSYIQLLASTNGHACKRTLCHKPNIDTHTPTHFACHYAHFVTQPPSQPKSPLQLSSLLYSFFNPPPISYHTPSSFVKQWGDKKIDENYVMG